ncbi:MAG: tRNA pseudouridine(55) synthase TruB [Ndongobacter sp.]|nr:tRNA pseudouridine(55) synthase TruB [Ndongobacter sp.]
MKSGILNVYKEAGMTSHDVVAIVRGVLGMKRIGHTGTLDPMATGVLPVCVGKATRLADLISAQGKAYLCTCQFGYATNTLDATGTVLEQAPRRFFSRGEIEEAMVRFQGPILQKPPMFSAVRKNGRRLYEYARRGEEVEREARPVTIAELRLVSLCEDRLSFYCRCSKGTYIRVLVDEIGRALGSLATMTTLERVEAGPYKADDATPISRLKEMSREQAEALILPMETAVAHLPGLHVTEEAARRLCCGQEVAVSGQTGFGAVSGAAAEGKSDAMEQEELSLFGPDGFLGLGRMLKTEAGTVLKLKKLLCEMPQSERNGRADEDH